MESRPGITVFRVTGPRARETFAAESGGHRWQRVPPTEKRGRVHTSTVTVAVLDEPTEREVVIADRDLEFTATRGSGAGGQNRNKVETVAVLRHKPTGIVVRCETERSQHRNRDMAMRWLRAKLWALQRETSGNARAADRKGQVGSGMRGDKRRTIRAQDDNVVDHVSGRRWKMREYLSGEW